MLYSRKLAVIIFNMIIFCAIFMIFPNNNFANESLEQASSKQTDSDSKFVSIDFNNVDITVFIKFMSKLTGKNFIVDNRVKGNVTIISPTKISVKNAYKVFESVLDINGFSTVKSGEIIKIVPTPKAKADNLDTKIATEPGKAGSINDQIVTRIIPLEYARSDELKSLFTPLVPKGSVILSYRDTNMMIITATLSSIDRILKIIKVIDVQSIGKKISVIPVNYADAKKMVQSLSSIFTFRAQGIKRKKNTEQVVKFVADERTNSIIFLASKVETERVAQLIDLLDQQVPKGEEKIRVYYLEHADAENLVKVLMEIPTKDTKQTAPGQKKTPILSSKVKIMADNATNSLIIMADKEDYPVLEEVISKLDIPRAMVYIECLIMEVNVTRGLNIGTEWKASSDSAAVFGGFGGTGDSGYTNISAVSESGSLPKGFSVGVLGDSFNIGGVTFPDIQAVVTAYQNDKDVNIISTPQILTTENEEAIITVGKNIPYQTKSAAESSSETYSSYEYKDVGTTLKITPQISKDRLVRLNINVELTVLDSVNQSSPDRPTTFKRQIETTIIVEDSNSVVIGGLIGENLTKENYQTPCLGSIPGLGWAFKSVSEGKEITNLYIFLTPTVVKNPLEAKKIYNKKNKEINSIKRGEITMYNKLNPNKDDEMNKIIKNQKLLND